MALTGMQIFKLLPKTNCKECGVPTCLAFAMNLANKNDATDKKLGFTELGSIDLNAEIAAEAKAGLGLSGSLTLAFGQVSRPYGPSGRQRGRRHQDTFSQGGPRR